MIIIDIYFFFISIIPIDDRNGTPETILAIFFVYYGDPSWLSLL